MKGKREEGRKGGFPLARVPRHIRGAKLKVPGHRQGSWAAETCEEERFDRKCGHAGPFLSAEKSATLPSLTLVRLLRPQAIHGMSRRGPRPVQIWCRLKILYGLISGKMIPVADWSGLSSQLRRDIRLSTCDQETDDSGIIGPVVSRKVLRADGRTPDHQIHPLGVREKCGPGGERVVLAPTACDTSTAQGQTEKKALLPVDRCLVDAPATS